MKLLPAGALIGLAAALPFYRYTTNGQPMQQGVLAMQAKPKQVLPVEPHIENLFPIKDVESFFHYKKDPKKGFIYIEADKSTEGIANHLMQKHGINDLNVITEIIKGIDNMAAKFNQAATSNRKQVQIKLSDLGEEPKIPGNLDELSDKELRNLINVLNILTPGIRDYLDSPDKVLEVGESEGLAKEVSVLQQIDIMTTHGFPVAIFPQGEMDIKEGSAKLRLYRDPQSKTIRTCVYLELEELPGRIGKGGINGIIIPKLPAVIITNKKMYLIGFDKFEVKEEEYNPKQRKWINPQHLPFPKPKGKGNRLSVV